MNKISWKDLKIGDYVSIEILSYKTYYAKVIDISSNNIRVKFASGKVVDYHPVGWAGRIKATLLCYSSSNT
jgi:hypothetical protein